MFRLFIGRVLTVCLLLSPTVAAQTQRQTAPAVSQASMLADQFVMLARAALAGRSQVREDQLIRARILLDLALQLNPNDTNVWRLRSDLARHEKDRDAQLEALRQYVRRTPLDDAAQLELLLMGLAQHQTLDLRIAAAVNMLDGPAGQQLSPAVQSRLASFVASSFHELGQDDEFGKRLAQALRLDSSNIAAARMAYELAVSRQRTRADIAQALLNLVRANPADPATRQRFGESLLDIGLGAHAASQFNAAMSLARQPMDEGFYRDWAAALILAGQTQEATQMLDQLEQVFSRMAAEQASKEGQDPATAPRAGLPMELVTLRLVMHETPEQSQPSAAAAEAFRVVYDTLKTQADGGDVDAASRLAMLSLVCSRRVESVQPYVDAVATDLGEGNVRVQVLRAWQKFRSDDVEAAKTLLTESPAAAKDPYGSYLIVLMGDVSDPRRQAVMQQIVQQDPSSLVGLIAARTLARVGKSVEPERNAARIGAQLERWPGSLRVPNMAVQPWISLQLAIDPQRYGYLEPITVRVRLTNRTDLPLSIGDPTGPSALPRNVLVSVSLRQTDPNAPQFAPIVVDMGRGIRIEPQQTIEATQRLDRSMLGAMLVGLPTQQVNFSLSAVYDLQPGTTPAQGRTGVLGASDKINLVQVAGMPINAANVDQWVSDLDDRNSIERYQSLARLTLIAQRLSSEAEAGEMATRISQRLVEGFAAMPAQDQAWVARFVGRDDVSRNRLGPLHQAMGASDDPLVRIMYVATHAESADSALLAEAMRVRDPNVISFARALQAGLRAEAAQQ